MAGLGGEGVEVTALQDAVDQVVGRSEFGHEFRCGFESRQQLSGLGIGAMRAIRLVLAGLNRRREIGDRIKILRGQRRGFPPAP